MSAHNVLKEGEVSHWIMERLQVGEKFSRKLSKPGRRGSEGETSDPKVKGREKASWGFEQ